MKRKQLDYIQSLIDNARLNCNRANDLVLVVLDECKRPPYLNADEIETVYAYLETASVHIGEALEKLTNKGGE